MSICKTCRNYDVCKLDIKDRVHCCSFVYPKEEKHDKEIRNKAIDEFAERLKDSLIHNYRHLLNVDTDGFEWLTTDAVGTHINEIADKMKGE